MTIPLHGTDKVSWRLRAVLVAAVLLLVAASPASAVTYIDASMNVDHFNLTYDDHVVLLQGVKPTNNGALSVRMTGCRVSNAGLTVQGYRGAAAPPLRGTLEIAIAALSVDNATVTFRDAMPPNTFIRIVGTTASRQWDAPVFLLVDLYLRHNVTFIIESSQVTFAEYFDNSSMLDMRPTTHSIVIDDRSGLFILDAAVTGGSGLVRVVNSGSLVVSNNSVLALDRLFGFEVFRMFLVLDLPMTITNNSLFRLTRAVIVSHANTLGEPALAHNTVTVSNSSLYLLKNVVTTSHSPSIFATSRGPADSWFNLDSSSAATFYGVSSFRLSGLEKHAIPANAEQGRGVRVGAFYLNGVKLSKRSEYIAAGFQPTFTMIDDADRFAEDQGGNVAGECARATCLLSNTVAPEREGPTCNCVCVEGASEPNCAGTAFDPTQFFWFAFASPTMCAVSHCAVCDTVNLALCATCNSGYRLTEEQDCVPE